MTSTSEFTTGKYVLIASNGYAPTVLDGSWILAGAVSAANNTVTNPADNTVWNITVTGTNAVLTDSNGKTVIPQFSGNKVKEGTGSWTWTFENGVVIFTDEAGERYLTSNGGSDHKFRAYNYESTVKDNDTYAYQFTLYKLIETN